MSSLAIGDKEPLDRTMKINWRLAACSDRPSDYKNPLGLSCYISNPVIFHHFSKMDPIFRENNLPKQKWTKALEVQSDQGDAVYGPFTDFDLLDRESSCQSPTLNPLPDTLGPQLQGDTLREVNSLNTRLTWTKHLTSSESVIDDSQPYGLHNTWSSGSRELSLRHTPEFQADINAIESIQCPHGSEGKFSVFLIL